MAAAAAAAAAVAAAAVPCAAAAAAAGPPVPAEGWPSALFIFWSRLFRGPSDPVQSPDAPPTSSAATRTTVGRANGRIVEERSPIRARNACSPPSRPLTLQRGVNSCHFIGGLLSGSGVLFDPVGELAEGHRVVSARGERRHARRQRGDGGLRLRRGARDRGVAGDYSG